MDARETALRSSRIQFAGVKDTELWHYVASLFKYMYLINIMADHGKLVISNVEDDIFEEIY